MKIDQRETKLAQAIAEWSMRWIKPRSVVHFGAGTGQMLQPFDQANVHTLGIDIETPQPGAQLCRNLTHLDVAEPGLGMRLGRYDLGICLELVEHLRQDQVNEVCENLGRSCRWVIFSGNQVPDPERGHINARPRQQWVKLLERAALIEDGRSTRELLEFVRRRGYADQWFQANAMVAISRFTK